LKFTYLVAYPAGEAIQDYLTHLDRSRFAKFENTLPISLFSVNVSLVAVMPNTMMTKRRRTIMKTMMRKKEKDKEKPKTVPMNEDKKWVVEGWAYVSASPTNEPVFRFPASLKFTYLVAYPAGGGMLAAPFLLNLRNSLFTQG
jgi:hypothetical protein